MNGNTVTRFDEFSGSTRTFPELEEPPDYFLKEVKQSRQMNFQELGAYIRNCSRAASTPSRCRCNCRKSSPSRCSR